MIPASRPSEGLWFHASDEEYWRQREVSVKIMNDFFWTKKLSNQCKINNYKQEELSFCSTELIFCVELLYPMGKPSSVMRKLSQICCTIKCTRLNPRCSLQNWHSTLLLETGDWEVSSEAWAVIVCLVLLWNKLSQNIPSALVSGCLSLTQFRVRVGQLETTESCDGLP